FDERRGSCNMRSRLARTADREEPARINHTCVRIPSSNGTGVYIDSGRADIGLKSFDRRGAECAEGCKHVGRNVDLTEWLRKDAHLRIRVYLEPRPHRQPSAPLYQNREYVRAANAKGK